MTPSLNIVDRDCIMHLPSALGYPETNRKSRANNPLKWYFVTDNVGLIAAFLIALMLSTFVNHILFGRTVFSPYFTQDLIRFAQPAIIASGVLLWFQYSGHYRIRMPFWPENQKIVSTLFFAMLINGFLFFAEKQSPSRLWLMSSWLIAMPAIITLRSLLRVHLRKEGLFQLATLLVGMGENAKRVEDALKSEPGLGYEIKTQIKNLPIAFLQAGASWKRLCLKYGANHVIIALDGDELVNAKPQLMQLAREHISFSVSPPMQYMPVSTMVPQYFFSHDTLLMTSSSNLERSLNCFMKRALDVLLSGGALLALSPVMLIVAALVKKDGGPALFGHQRLGRNGKIFFCLKFRSMIMDSNTMLEKYLAQNPIARKEWLETRKLRYDPRVTKLGAFLRKSSLDELPQLINVLRGDMSLVGPRPIVYAEVDNYEGDIAHYYRVRPGITGLWQVSGRNDVSYTQRVHLDSWYVRNWSFWHDIAILCKTVPALLQRRGAY